MESVKYVALTHFCSGHQIAPEFMVQLCEYGLIELVPLKNENYIPIEELPKTEKIIRLYSELDINLEGISVITQLLDQVEELNKEINHLKNKLSVYQK